MKGTFVTEPVKQATKDAEAEDAEADSGLGSSKIKSLINTLQEYRLSVY